jgi:RNA 2',3'-cyclic 3'-phosphodiesterase
MRLFFALWPGERVRASLAHVAGALASLADGKPVSGAKIHLTLAFLGEIESERLVAVRDAARQARASRFELVLDEAGSFRKAGVAWAGPSHVPAALADLQSSLDLALRARGFALEDRPFAAHVTLTRKISTVVPRAPMPAIRWRPRDFALVRSQTGTGRYAVMETWPLERG